MKRTAEAHKAELLAEVLNARSKALNALHALPPDRRREPFLGVWSSYELVAHLIGWDFTNLQAVEDVLAGQLPRFYAHHDRDWRTYNAHLVATYAVEGWDDLLAAVADSHRQLMARLSELPAGEFEKERGIRFRGWKVTIARLLQAEAEDESTHAAQVTAFGERILAGRVTNV